MLSSTGCTEEQGSTSSEEQIINVGAVLPLTGPAAVYGERAQEGMRLAVDEINKGGGIEGDSLNVIYRDSQNDPKMGVSAMKNLLTQDMPVIISAMTGVSFSALPVVEQTEKVMMMTLVTHPKAAERSRWAFRHYLNKGKAARRMASFAYDSLDVREAAILCINDEGGAGESEAFRSRFTSLGGQIVAEETYETDASTMRSQISVIKQEEPEVVYFCGYGRAYGIGVNQMREYNIDAQILTSYDPLYEPIQKAAGDALNGIIFTAPRFGVSSSLASEFRKQYEKRYGTVPTLDSAFGYDVIMMITEALRKAGSNPSAIRKALLALENHEGVFGNVAVQDNGDTEIEIRVRRMENLKGVPVSISEE